MKPDRQIPDLSEKGRDAAGQVISLNRRLFLQLQVFTGCDDPAPLAAALEAARVRGALYADLSDPRGVGVVAGHENPDYFTTAFRDLLNRPPFRSLALRPDLTMTGRTYSIGYEADLENVLIERPLSRITKPEHRWAVWYPLRRKGLFEKLPKEEQRDILNEHGELGMLFSAGGYGQDIRLDCRGLDRNDNDFVIGLIGKELFPLSAMVQAMRRTRQTSEFLERLGPFFIGRVLWQSGPA